jgi:hypothetical protein
MAIACPVCGRPNSESAAKCLYCVSPLEPLGELAEKAAPAAPPAEHGRYLLILLPGNGPQEEGIREFSRIAEVSPYEARLSLSSPRPRLFRWLDSEAEARRMSSELSSVRIPHYVVSESTVLSLPVACAKGLEFQDRHLEIRIEGQPGPSPAPSNLTVPVSDVLLLIRGEITRERHDERRLGTTRSVSRRLTPGLRLHLYPREAAIGIEIDPESFDFQALGSDRSASALLNLDRLLARLVDRTPGAELDRGFDQEPAIVARSGRPDLGDALAESKRGSEGVLYDNEGQFRFYARWRYRVARHAAARG